MYEIIKIVATSLLGFASGVGLVYVKYYLDNKKKPGVSFDADLDRRNKVKSFLIEALAEFKPARTGSYLLHNGGTYFTGDHMQKIKLYEEQTRDKSVATLKKDFDSVLIEGGIHLWIDSMREAKKRGPHEEVICQADDPNLHPEILAYLEYYGIKSSYAMLLRNPVTTAPVGLFVCSYDLATTFSPALLVGLRQHAHRLEKILLAK